MVDSKTPVETGAHTASEKAKWPFYFVIYATTGLTHGCNRIKSFKKIETHEKQKNSRV
jgi:hypothetical protein